MNLFLKIIVKIVIEIDISLISSPDGSIFLNFMIAKQNVFNEM